MKENKVTFKVECLGNGVAHYTHNRREAYETFQKFISDYEDEIRLYEAPMPVNDHDSIEWETIDYYDKNEDDEASLIYTGEELGITPGEWKVIPSDTDSISTPFQIRTDKTLIAQIFWGISRVLPETFEEVEANAKAICLSVNETIKKGYNPAAMGEVVEALELIISSPEWTKLYGGGAVDKKAKTALINAKLQNPK